MTHGIPGYFVELERSSRRVALVALAVSLVALGVLWASRTPTAGPVRTVLERAIRETVRFGYEGPDQYVRRITLEHYVGRGPTLTDVGDVVPAGGRRGGDRSPSPSAEDGTPSPSRPGTGPGESDSDLIPRAVSRLADVPVVRSEDLVIDHLVRPEYPPAMQERNIEGKVMIQALIDTAGRVIDVQVLASSGQSQFERAAEAAVWQCRFRPYRPQGASREVYAVFRFAFRIY